ncbi:MAG: hypothetical protein EOO44_14980 [Flavobacterium sp.]|nr:MAG: hypothetical protein EOO44_14980 [Flavobacterium sp.]
MNRENLRKKFKKKSKIILLLSFLFFGVGSIYIIYTEIGWNNFNVRMKDFVGSIFPKNDEELQNEKTVSQDIIQEGGYTLVEKFDKNIEPFPDDELALYFYYKFPFTKEFKENEEGKPKPQNLQPSTLKPTAEDAQNSFNLYLQGRLTDFVERGLSFNIGKCYKNDKIDIYESKTCVTCNVIVFTPNKKDAVKTIHVFGAQSYDFYYDKNDYPKWKVTDATMNIPFDYKLYEKYNEYLNQIGFKINASIK